MTIPVKIQCGCGQRYAFDVETEGELQPGAVACPTCGIDGTTAANVVIVQNLAAQPAAAAKERVYIIPPPTPARAANPPTPPVPTTRASATAHVLSDDARQQAEFEAKAKVLWGDEPEEVIKFLMLRGFSGQEASEKVRLMFKERLAAIRANGIGKILMGIFMAVGAATTFLFLVRIGFVSIWLLGAAGIACVSGLWMILTGILKVLAPKSERGDASEND